METGFKRNPPWVAALSIALTAAGWWWAAGLQPLWWAAWLAPAPLLFWSVRTRASWAALGSLLAFALGGLSLWTYAREVIGLPLAICVQIVVEPALRMMLAVLLFRALARQGRPLMAMLGFALTTTGLSWVAAELSPHGTYGHLAYSQMEALPVIQIAAVTGLWGIGFLVCLFPAMIAAVATPGAAARSRWRAALLGTAVLALALSYGGWRLQDREPVQQRVRIGLVNIGLARGSDFGMDKAAGQRLLSAYVAQMDRLAARGARIIVAPEASLLVRAHAIEPLQRLADRRGVRLLIGVDDRAAAPLSRNTALIFEPGAASPVAYYKHRFIPGLDDGYTAGTARTMLPGTAGVGVAICKDLDFTDIGPAYAQLGARLLLVPAWDFGVDGWMHARIAVLRGVEGGFAMARTARDGVLTLSDDRGRVLMQASSAGIGQPTALLGDLPLRGTRTLYARWGDVCGWGALLAAAMLATGSAFIALRARKSSLSRRSAQR